MATEPLSIYYRGMEGTIMTTIIETLETEGHAALTWAQHAAAWLVGTVAVGEASLAKMEADDPLIAAAIEAGLQSAVAHGVPVTAIADMAGVVLGLARDLAAGLSQPAPGQPGNTVPVT
jgi:hypothetical protein